MTQEVRIVLLVAAFLVVCLALAGCVIDRTGAQYQGPPNPHRMDVPGRVVLFRF